MNETYLMMARELKKEIDENKNPNVKELKKMFDEIYNKLPKFYKNKVDK